MFKKMSILLFVVLFLGLSYTNYIGASTDNKKGLMNVMDYGAVGDGITDDSDAIQMALNAAASRGGIVYFPAVADGYKIGTGINVPAFVTILGSGSFKIPQKDFWGSIENIKNTGTTFLVYDTVNPAVTLQTNSSIYGVRFYYPDQTDTNPPVEFPAAIDIGVAATGSHIERVVIVNGWDGITATSNHERLVIRDTYLWCFNRGIQINNSVDVNRLENIHIWPLWSKDMSPDKSRAYAATNAIGILIYGADAVIIDKLFVYGMRFGLYLDESTGKTSYGSLSNSGFDMCQIGIIVNKINTKNAWNIKNTSFAVGHEFGLPGEGIHVSEFADGNLNIYNCSFWGGQNILRHLLLRGNIKTNINNCSFYDSREYVGMIRIMDMAYVSIVGNHFGERPANGAHVNMAGYTGDNVIIENNNAEGEMAIYNP